MSDRAVRLGWWLSSEEHDSRRLVEHAYLAERSGFRTVMISDHLLPWVRSQAHAGHVWTTVGAIAQATDGLEVGTGVTAMIHRTHPITVAHAAATAAILLEGRFFLGVGTGERLNEQPFGRRWPGPGERRDRLREAIDVIRQVWQGRNVNLRGRYWRVENLRLLERPASPPPIHVAVSSGRSARMAGESGDGIIAVTPDARLVDAFHGAGGDGPRIGQLHVSLAATMDAAVDQAAKHWPNGAVPPALLTELARPEHFEAVAAAAGRDAVRDSVVCATDAGPVIRAINRFVGAGFDTIYVHQVGPDQRRLADLATGELLPHYHGER
jgi:coenzyme F420-dependent glucose-6-phosphate dehydrogenase